MLLALRTPTTRLATVAPPYPAHPSPPPVFLANPLFPPCPFAPTLLFRYSSRQTRRRRELVRSTKGVVTVTKGERKSAEGTEGKSGTENVNRKAEKERRRNREDSSAEGSGKSARERTRGDNFRERGLRGPPRRSAESPSSPGAAARIFLPLSGPLSRPLFFFPAGPPSRRARCFSSPWTASIFLFERLRSHAPAPQWPRARKFVAGAAPFPATPASFSPIPLAPQPPFSRTPVALRFPARPPSYALFSLPFFVPTTPPPPPPAADVDVDPTIRRLRRSRVRCTLQLRPRGVF